MQAVVTQEIKPVGRLDADAFLSLVREFDLRHRRLAFRLLGDRDRMDDVLQEAYGRAFRALPRFRPRGGSSSAASVRSSPLDGP